MDLRFLGLWAVVQCLSAVVNVASSQDCTHQDIPNGYVFSEQNPRGPPHTLYYACDQGFIPVEGSWWATVTCQSGHLSSTPQCIKDTSCFEPSIANGIYEKFLFKQNKDSLWIKCKSGYEDRNKHATAHCENGQWTKLPVCEKTNSSCGPPPPISDAVIIDKVYEDIFSVDTEVQYVCQAGFELETPENKAVCSYGHWAPLPSCRKKQINLDSHLVTSIPTRSNDNDQPRPRAVQDGAKDTSTSSGSDDSQHQMFTTIDKCDTPPTVNNGDFNIDEGQMLVTYHCNYWYKLKGNSIVRCLNGLWTPPPTCEDDFCELDTCRFPRYLENKGNVFIKSGTTVKLSCFDSTWTTARAVCTETKQLHLSECCYKATHKVGVCTYTQIFS